MAKKKSDAAIQKAIELDNSVLLDVHKWSGHPEVKRAVDVLFQVLKSDPLFEGNENLRKRHVQLVLLNLLVAWKTDPTLWVAYYRKSNAYKAGSRYNSLHISKLTVPIVDALIEMEMISHEMGYKPKDPNERSYLSRMRATKKLISMIVDEYSLTEEMIESHPERECIILRERNTVKKRQVDIEYEDNISTKKWRDNLCAYNNLLRRSFIDIPHFPREGLTVETRNGNPAIFKIGHLNKFIRRIFNNGTWEHGGRFYGGWWQHIPKDWRARIRINSEPTIELDYSGLHIVILYALNGIDYWNEIECDPYNLGQGFENSPRMRGLLKQILLTLINASNPKEAINAIRKEINFNSEEYGWVKTESISISAIVERFQTIHEPIQEYFSSGAGIKLQNIDARMAERVINTFTKINIPVLCVHDSFIIAAKHMEQLKDEMGKAFQDILSESTEGEKSNTSKIKRSTPNKVELRKAIEVTNLSDYRSGIVLKMAPSELPKQLSISAPEAFAKMPTLRGIKGKNIVRQLIKYGEKLEVPDEEYEQRWKDHQNKDWEKDYYKPPQAD